MQLPSGGNRNISYVSTLHESRACFNNVFDQIVFQPPAIDLIAGRRKELAEPNLDALRERLVAVVEEEPQPKLWKTLPKSSEWNISFLSYINTHRSPDTVSISSRTPGFLSLIHPNVASQPSQYF